MAAAAKEISRQLQKKTRADALRQHRTRKTRTLVSQDRLHKVRYDADIRDITALFWPCAVTPAGANNFRRKCSEYTSTLEVASSGGALMTYCILRTKKLKTFGSIAGSAQHTFREIPTPNADSSRTHLNWTSGANSSSLICGAVKSLLPEKRRKDAVLCIEYLITASPEWFEGRAKNEWKAYFNNAIDWLKDRHGAENLVCLNLQRDEKSPHLVAYVVPNLKDGRLSAKEFLGGRAKLTAMQTDFSNRVGKPAGLSRGLEGSTTKHTTAKQYSAALAQNPTMEPPKPPSPTMADRISGKAKAMEADHHVRIAAYGKFIQQARDQAQQAKKAKGQHDNALEKLRADAKELVVVRKEVVRLRAENNRLTTDLTRQRKFFEDQIAKLNALLATATETIKKLFSEKVVLVNEVEKLSGQIDVLQPVISARQSPGARLGPR